MTSPEATLGEAVSELRRVTEALQQLIKREYPTRSELEGKLRRRILGGALFVVTATLISAFVVIGTVSTCFLNGPSRGVPQACDILPGFRETIEYNENTLRRFNETIERGQRNERRIERLEERLGLP